MYYAEGKYEKGNNTLAIFVAQQVTHSHTISLPAEPASVFPLFEPLGERLWEHNWDPTLVYPTSGSAQEGMVFTTQHGSDVVKIWTMVIYERDAAHLRYFNLLPYSHTSLIDIRCDSDGAKRCVARIMYSLTALSPQGNSYINGFTEEHYRIWISSWGDAITHYLLHE
jgi:hypothetical protein